MGGWCVGYGWQCTGQSGIYVIVMVWEAGLYKHRFGIYPDPLHEEQRRAEGAITWTLLFSVLTQRDSLVKKLK